MDTGTQHVVSLLRALADDIEAGLSSYFDVKTDTGFAQGHGMLGLTAEQRAFQRFEIKAEINPNAPKRCPECRSALVGPGGKCVTVECPVDAQDPGPFTWYLDDGQKRHVLPCNGFILESADGTKLCETCGAMDR